MRLQIALPAIALLLGLSMVTWVRAPHPQAHSPREIVTRAGAGAIRAIAGAGDRNVAPEETRETAPLTLTASRPDSVEPAAGPAGFDAIERYHEQALESAREACAPVIAPEPASATVMSYAVAEFEKKREQPATTAAPKPKCTKASLEIPVLGCYLKQAASALAG